MKLKTKRVYDKPLASDGYRILIDRLWPRGISKEQASLDNWIKDIAPSTELRKWFDHKPEKYDEFKTRYNLELDKNPAVSTIRGIMTKYESVTLLYGAKDPNINHAQVLLDYLSRI